MSVPPIRLTCLSIFIMGALLNEARKIKKNILLDSKVFTLLVSGSQKYSDTVLQNHEGNNEEVIILMELFTKE